MITSRGRSDGEIVRRFTKSKYTRKDPREDGPGKPVQEQTEAQVVAVRFERQAVDAGSLYRILI